MMKTEQRGFTMIELVMVIVILGVLAAVALPKFVDLGSDARTASITGAAGALSSYAAINYAAAQAKNSQSVAVSGATPANGLTGGMATWDAAFKVSSQGSCTAAGGTVGVTLTHSGGTTANSAVATIVCTG
jgi:MSHA pilin protein MshA